jgi:nicotinate-nucleotide adenylyltransferase
MADSSKDTAKQKTNALGIMGGTFDPIHVGHLRVAEVAGSKLMLDRVVFVPAFCPPHKSISDITPIQHRFAMVSEAVTGIPRFEVSGIEMGHQCPMYAGDTIRAFKEMEGNNRDIYFITGLDAILIIINWDRARTYHGLCKFVAATRPGYDRVKIESQIPHEFRPYVTILEEPALSVSSTEIRHRVKNGQSIEEMVPQAVMDYIYRHGLYV